MLTIHCYRIDPQSTSDTAYPTVVLTMSDDPRRTDFSQGSDPLDQTIETTIPVKKPAADLPSDDFFKRTGFKPIYATGSEGDTLAGRVEGIHVLRRITS